MKKIFTTETIKKLKKSSFALLLLFVVFSGTFLVYIQSVEAIDWAGQIGSKIIGIFSTIFWGLQFAAEFMLSIGQWIMTFVFDVFLIPEMYEEDFIRDVWEIMRDFANMFFILWLVAMALATILDIKSWSAKKLLPKLLAIALLVNFSLLITTVIIDFSNASTKLMADVRCKELRNKATEDSGDNAVEKMNAGTCLRWGLNTGSLFSRQNPKDIFSKSDISNALGAFAQNFFGFIILIVAAGVFLMIGSMMVVRTVVLWLLMVVAPIAFVIGIMPFGSQWLKKWWGMLTQWSFYGISVAFVLRLGVEIVSAMSFGEDSSLHEHLDVGKAPAFSVGEGSFQTEFFSSATNIIKYLIITIIFFAAYKTAQNMSSNANDFVTDKVGSWGSKKAKQAVSSARSHTTGKAGRAMTSGAAGKAADWLGSYEDSGRLGSGIAGRGKAALSEARGRRQAERTKGERKRLKNMSRQDLLKEAKSNNVEAQRLAAKRHWAENKAEVPQGEVEDWHENLSGYPDAQETLAEDRPDVGEGDEEDVEIKEFELNSKSNSVTISPGDKLGISWEVDAQENDKDADEAVHQVKISVSGDAGDVPGVESVEGDQKVEGDIPNLVEHSFPLKEDKTVNFQLLAFPQGGGPPEKKTLSATFEASSSGGSKNSGPNNPGSSKNVGGGGTQGGNQKTNRP